MGALDRSRVSLRFFGDDLDPAEVTALLGVEPTASSRKGQVEKRSRGGDHTPRRGSWRLHATNRSPGDLDGQIGELLGQVTDDLAVWRDLTRRFRADLFCGLFLRDGNEGESLRPETLLAMGTRGLQLDFDIYAPDDSDCISRVAPRL